MFNGKKRQDGSNTENLVFSAWFKKTTWVGTVPKKIAIF